MDRTKSIGGSDSPVILGVSPFKDRLTLWGQKRGTLPPEEETPAMKRGKILEPIVANLYSEATGRKLEFAPTNKPHPDYPWLTGSIDRMIVQPETDIMEAPLEIKCPGLKVFAKCLRQGVPEYYMVQNQHYQAVIGKTWGSLAVFNAERWELIFFDVNRDDELINMIIVKDAEFWQMVQDGVPPVELPAPVLDLPKVEPQEVYTLDSPDWAYAVKRFRESRSLREEAEVLEKESQEVIQMLMAEHTVVEGDGLRVYWKEQAGRKSVDGKLLQATHPDIYQQVLKQGKPFKSFRPYFLKEVEIE